MAILAVKIDTLATLRMNEFFDYAGSCWALSRSRDADGAVGVDLEDFYEGTVRSSCMKEIPVVFIYDNHIVGWYEKAEVYRYIRHPALFLEGNIRGETRCARLLVRPVDVSDKGLSFCRGKTYLVLEAGDERHDMIKQMISEGKGPFEVIDYARAKVDARLKSGQLFYQSKGILTNQAKALMLLMQCEALAKEIMEDHCPGIQTVKGFLELAQDAARCDSRNVNAWYYLAMANYQLGFVKKGLKAIERALKLEPDGDDLYIMKGNLLVSNGSLQEALGCYEKAYFCNGDETCFIMAGKACMNMGSPVAARQYFRRVKDKKLLKDFQVTLGRKKFNI